MGTQKIFLPLIFLPPGSSCFRTCHWSYGMRSGCLRVVSHSRAFGGRPWADGFNPCGILTRLEAASTLPTLRSRPVYYGSPLPSRLLLLASRRLGGVEAFL